MSYQKAECQKQYTQRHGAVHCLVIDFQCHPRSIADTSQPTAPITTTTHTYS